MGYIHLVNLRYLRFGLLKYMLKTDKKICNTFDDNFKNIPLYIMRKVLFCIIIKASSLILKTLFNIVEERLKKLLNFDVSAV